MIDAVYLCRAGPNEELRYSLRSLVNIPHARVWLLGPGPEWYVGARIPVDQTGTKGSVTTRGIRLACNSTEISDPFMYFNDDFYVMKPGGPLPPLNRGEIRAVVDQYASVGLTPASSRWIRGMRDTAAILRARGVAKPLSYELHIPLMVHKAEMLEALDLIARRGMGHKRSVYGNIANLGGRVISDVKVRRLDDPIPRGRWLSSADRSFPVVEHLLESRFPDPSPWEDC